MTKKIGPTGRIFRTFDLSPASSDDSGTAKVSLEKNKCDNIPREVLLDASRGSSQANHWRPARRRSSSNASWNASGGWPPESDSLAWLGAGP
jgi:hypothetical protein